jgi:hypothetical protein
MGLAKQSVSGAVASVAMEQAPDSFSSCAIAATLEMSARVMFDGWKGKAPVAPASVGPEPEPEGVEPPQAVTRTSPPAASARARLAYATRLSGRARHGVSMFSAI